MASWLSSARTGALVAVIASVVLVARLESPFEPVVWQNPTSLPALEGALAPNDRLLPTEHLHEGDLIAPEAFAEGDDGALYTGLWDGRVVKLDANGENPETIFFTGGVISEAGKELGSTTGVDYGSRLLHACHDKAKEKKLTPEDERECGRPLGVRWRSGKLYILDSYHGLFELDVAKGHAKHLIDSSKDVPLPLAGGSGKPAAAAAAAAETGLPLALLNDLTFTKEGTIFLTDSSWKHTRAYNRLEIIDGGPRGRLLRFDPKSGDLRTVMCGLHFPNGVEIDQSGTKLLLVESLRFRVLEVNLDALSTRPDDLREGMPPSLVDALEFCGEDEVLPSGVRIFAKAMPGFVDNLEFNHELGGYVAGVGTKVTKPFSPLHLTLQKPGVIRTTLGKLFPIEILDKLAPNYGLVVVLGLDGSIKESMHDNTGRTAFVSSAFRSSKSGYTFLGSSQNFYLGRVRL